ncbi:hypothetical protein M3Y99_01631100 [Aphelenchoides fujianensis]|nr:hypothetical protein M3Y99_01631100 [Aphelenchoides fujianensis]
MHGLFIFGGLYKFRHDVLTNNSTSIRDLLKVLGLTSACGLFTGLSLVLAIHQTKERGDEFYIHQLDPNWREHPDLRYYMHAVDIRDAGGMGFFYGGLLFAVLWVTVAAWYTWKAFRFVNTTAVRTSERTAALQRQFTLSLIVQTVNACIFAVVPVTLICVAMLFRLEGDFVGTCTLLPLSWLPFVNAALTIYVVKAYRSFVVSLFSTKKRKEESGNSSGERRFVQTSTNAIEDKSNILV